MQQGIPGSAPPSSWAPGNNDLGPTAGVQSSQEWTSTQSDSRPILSMMRAPHLWRVTVYGSNVKLTICYGTSKNKRLVDILTPCRVVLPGSVDIYAAPIIGDLGSAGSAHVTCTPVTSGSSDSECRKFAVVGAIEDDAVRFVALEASHVRVGNLNEPNITVAVAALQSVSLVAGSALIDGGGFLEFEP